MSFQTGDIVRIRDGNPLDCITGVVEQVGKRQIKVRFFRLPWTSLQATLPGTGTSYFPHEQLVKCRDPWSDAAQEKWSTLKDLQLRVRAAEFWLGNNHGQLGNARTDLLPHQVFLVHKVVERSPRRLMIAEEVGMGKTIETGMIIHAFMQRGEFNRCLIICPAGLINQWQKELESKFRIPFSVYRQDVGGSQAFTHDRVIASLDTVKLDKPSWMLGNKSHREILLSADDWDLVVFDEAHRLTAKTYGQKTEKILNYRLAEELGRRTRDFLFLTGTPHDGNDSKFRNLLKLLDPKVDFDSWKSEHFFGKIILKNRKSQAIGADGKKLFKNVQVRKISLSLRKNGEAQFHKALMKYLREGYEVAEQDPSNIRNRAIGFVMTTFQKLATSSIEAIKKSLQKRLDLLESQDQPADKREERSDSPDERFKGEAEESRSEELQNRKLRKPFINKELGMLRDLVNHPVPAEAKWTELCRLLDEITKQNPQEKFLIFTEYRGTVDFLKRELESRYGDNIVAIIMGGMNADARKESIDKFREDSSCRFLISTEAGGEGINLQFCHIMVNYDLPWNPFRVEQRIGRIHRIGQKHNMSVFNFQILNTIDAKLAEFQEDRVKNAVERLSKETGLGIEDIRGQLLGLAQGFIDYGAVYRDAFLKGNTRESEEEIARGFEEAEKACKIACDKIFGNATAPFNPERFQSLNRSGLTLEDMRVWLKDYLKSQNRQLMERKDKQLWEFLIPEEIKPLLPAEEKKVTKVTGTFDREMAIRHPEVELLAFGHPIIDIILRSVFLPNKDGCAVLSKPGNIEFSAWLLMRKDKTHTGDSAFRLLSVRRNQSGWELPKKLEVPSELNNLSDTVDGDLSDLKSEIVEFLKDQFPNVDFLEDQIYWLACVF